MKTIFFYIILAVILLSSNQCIYAQNDNEQIKIMLRKFYTAYSAVWASDISSKTLIIKLDSLQQEYCSLKLRKELKQLFQKAGLDHDMLINDISTEDISSLKTMSIIKDSLKTNGYIVSYTAIVTGMAKKKNKEQVTIHVTVVTEKGQYKIDSVK